MESEPCIECLFQGVLQTCKSNKINFKLLNDNHKSKIIESSKSRKDDCFTVNTEFRANQQFHHNCYCEYTSKEKIKRAAKKRKQEEIENFTRTKQLRK